MRRLLLLVPMLAASSASGGDHHRPKFDPVSTFDGRLVNPYGQGFRGAEGQGVFSGLFRPGVTDGPAVYRVSEYPFPPRRTHLGNAFQTVRIFHRRWP